MAGGPSSWWHRAVWAAATLLTWTSLAPAADPETWPLADALQVGDNRCMTKAELVANVQIWLARPGIDRRIQIVVDQIDDDSLRFVLSREGKPTAERRFHTSDVACPDLRAAVALAIALAIDATVMQAILEPVPVETPPPAPPPLNQERPHRVAPAAPREKPKPPPAREEAVLLEAEAQALVLLGVLPEPVVGGSIGAAAPLVDSFSLRLSGWGTLERSVAVGSGSSRVAMAAGQVSACLDEQLGAARTGQGSPRPVLRGCAGAAAGRWSAEGQGFNRDRTTALPWAAVVADLGVSLPLADQFAISTRLHGYFPFLRPVLEERDPRGGVLSATEPPPAGLGASAGVAVGFR
jgi:hypothetical protein